MCSSCRAAHFGLGAFLWVAALAAATVALARRLQEEGALQGEGRWLLAGAVVFAACLAWRASPLLQFLDILAIGLCLGLAALTLRKGSISRAGVLSYPLGLAVSGAHHAIGPFSLLFADVEWKELSRAAGTRHAAAAARGLIIAIPLLLLFGSLLAAADAVFAELLGRIFVWESTEWIGRVFGTLFFGFLAAGFLRTVLIREPEGLPRLNRPGGSPRDAAGPESSAGGGFALGPIETGVVLGLLNLLFLAFVLVQVRYLFGGAELVMGTADLTYAEYARSGFFELLQVTALVLPVMLALHWALPEADPTAHRLYRLLGTPLVGLLFIVMASAAQRMYLYVLEFGLTELRLYSTAFMLWMAWLFGWFLATVMRGARRPLRGRRPGRRAGRAAPPARRESRCPHRPHQRGAGPHHRPVRRRIRRLAGARRPAGAGGGPGPASRPGTGRTGREPARAVRPAAVGRLAGLELGAGAGRTDHVSAGN